MGNVINSFIMNRFVEWSEIFETILQKKQAIGLILKEFCEDNGNCIIIHDNPLKIEIHEREIRFVIEDEIAGILSCEGLKILNREAEKEIEYWCVALSSPGFKRYSIKRR